ncbi:Di-copper centre-containing protein [Ascobolus immersus RN42]|uniref:Di-copper centre-containing protein n=1 Tax=Ascobolus immersus RN42 TaxID=1160509 RepID=A0A3N4HUI3_ASCIM|nr:Di-copper centre-containing protein [Ascobolus immersus RN42]
MVALTSILSWTSLITLVASAALPEPSTDIDVFSHGPKKPQPKCKQVLKRRAWHKLTNREKKSYLDAVVCLMNKPTKTKLPFAVSRFDDFIKLHQLQANRIHGDGWFLPFHRIQMARYEQVLRSECGYKGAQPYWDEPRDAGRFSTAEIFDDEFGFGGDGSGELGGPIYIYIYGLRSPITTGPFATYTLHTGPGYKNIPHCIWRQIADIPSSASAQQWIDRCMALSTYAEFWPCVENGIMPGSTFPPPPPGFLEGELPPWPPGNVSVFPGDGEFVFAISPHNGGHVGVGGEMGNPVSSPGDPLFYMHHTFLDRIWWMWQKKDLGRRVGDIAGYTSQTPLDGKWVNATLEDELDMMGIGGNVRVREVMDSRGLCVEYD